MQRCARQFLRLSPQVQQALPLSLSRNYAGEGLKGFSEHEKTIEDLYFTKEDQRLFGKLLSKVKQQSDVADKHAAEGVKAAELSALKTIVDKYKISSADVEALLKWKHTHY